LNNRIFGCPKCGCTDRFLEHKLARIAYDFDDFGTEGMMFTYGNGADVDFDTAEPLAHGAYQCRHCGTHFDDPAELTPKQVLDPATNNSEGPPIRPDLIVSDADVTWWRAQGPPAVDREKARAVADLLECGAIADIWRAPEDAGAHARVIEETRKAMREAAALLREAAGELPLDRLVN
jgi:hypothetical protein